MDPADPPALNTEPCFKEITSFCHLAQKIVSAGFSPHVCRSSSSQGESWELQTLSQFKKKMSLWEIENCTNSNCFIFSSLFFAKRCIEGFILLIHKTRARTLSGAPTRLPDSTFSTHRWLHDKTHTRVETGDWRVVECKLTAESKFWGKYETV